MAQANVQSPYTTRPTVDNDVPRYVVPNSAAYAAPSQDEENGTIDSPIGAWSPTLRTAPDGLPDSRRLRVDPARDYRPDPVHPEGFWNAIDVDDARRHNVEDQDADGWEERKGGSGKPAARNPRENPPAEPRPTSRLAPRSYSFTRPMWGGPLLLDGIHFSMADHRRDYPVLGMQPVRSWRNTFRLDPAPWDTDLVDVPADSEPDYPQGRIQAVEVPLSQRWRL